MAEPEDQTPAQGGGGAAPRQPGIMVRGADGALYIVTEKDLAPFKVKSEAQVKQITELLRRAPTEVVSYDVPPNVMLEIEAVAKCIGSHIQVSFPREE